MDSKGTMSNENKRKETEFTTSEVYTKLKKINMVTKRLENFPES